MEKIILLLFDIGLLTIYMVIGFVIMMTIQLISYRIFNFNLYKFIEYILVEREDK